MAAQASSEPSTSGHHQQFFSNAEKGLQDLLHFASTSESKSEDVSLQESSEQHSAREYIFWDRWKQSPESCLLEISSLKRLWDVRAELSVVLKRVLLDESMEPAGAFAWLAVARSRIQGVASTLTVEEREHLQEEAGDYADALLEAIAGTAEGLLKTTLEHMGPTGSHGPGPPAVLHRVAALRRLCSLMAAAESMQSVDVGEESFNPREYIEDRMRSFFARSIRESLVDTNGKLLTPSNMEGSLARLTSTVSFIQQRTPLSLAGTLADVILAESSPSPQLQGSVLTSAWANARLGGGTAVEQVCRRLVQDVVLDRTRSGVVFSPALEGFRSTGGMPTVAAEELFTLPEMEAFTRTFGFKGVNTLASHIVHVMTLLVAHLDSILTAKQGTLSKLAAAIPLGTDKDRLLHELGDRHVILAVGIQIGVCLHALEILGDACATVLEDTSAGVYGVLEGFSCHLRRSIPEPSGAVELRQLAGRCGAAAGAPEFGGQSEEVLQVMLKVGCGGPETAWVYLPVLFASVMTTDLWEGCAYNPEFGDLSNNANCLVRCIHALMAASERASAERVGVMKSLLLAQMSKRVSGREMMAEEKLPTSDKVKFAISTRMQEFVHLASFLALADSAACSRGSWASRVILLDQLCQSSCYLPRSTLEKVLPTSLVKSAYAGYEQEEASYMHLGGWHPLFPNCSTLQAPFSAHIATDILNAADASPSPEVLSGSNSSNSTYGSSGDGGALQIDPNLVLKAYRGYRTAENPISVGQSELCSPQLVMDVSPRMLPLQGKKRWYLRQEGAERSSGEKKGPSPVYSSAESLKLRDPHDPSPADLARLGRSLKSQSGFLGPPVKDLLRQSEDERRKALSGPLAFDDLMREGAGVSAAPQVQRSVLEEGGQGGDDSLRSSGEIDGGGAHSAVKGKGWGGGFPKAGATPQRQGLKWSGALSAISGRILGGAKPTGQQQKGLSNPALSPKPAFVGEGEDGFLGEMFDSVMEEAARSVGSTEEDSDGMKGVSGVGLRPLKMSGEDERGERVEGVDGGGQGFISASALGLKSIKIPKPELSPAAR